MKCAVVKRRRHRRGTTLNEGTKPMGGFMPFGGMESGWTERECAALARIRGYAGTVTTCHGRLAAIAASADRATKVERERRIHEARRVETGKA